MVLRCKSRLLKVTQERINQLMRGNREGFLKLQDDRLTECMKTEERKELYKEAVRLMEEI